MTSSSTEPIGTRLQAAAERGELAQVGAERGTAPSRAPPAVEQTASAPTMPMITERGRSGSSRASWAQGASARAPPSPPATRASRNPQITACGADGAACADRLASASAPAISA